MNNRDALFYAKKYNLINVIEEIEKAKREIDDENYSKKITKIKSFNIQNSFPENINKELSPQSITTDNLGFFPYLNSYIDVDDWIYENNENIIIVYNLKKICLKRSYFIDISIDNLILECLYNNNTLLLKQMTNKEDYVNLKRYGFDNNIIINKDEFMNLLNNSAMQIFNLIKTNKKINGIDKAYVLYNPVAYNEYVKNFGISYEYQDTLAFYTSNWDNAINSYLRIGEEFFNSSYLNEKMKEFGNNKEEAKNNIENKIKIIDSAFYDAPKTQSNIILYRGIKHKLDEPIYDGIQLGYLSTTDDINVAFGFTSYDDNCCIYKLKLDIGIPYIFLDYISQTQGENEFLLPRGLILQFKKKYEDKGENIFEFFVKLNDKNRYKENSICKKYELVENVE